MRGLSDPKTEGGGKKGRKRKKETRKEKRREERRGRTYVEAERSEGSEMTFRGGHLRQQPKTCLDKILNLRRKKSLEKAHTVWKHALDLAKNFSSFWVARAMPIRIM